MSDLLFISFTVVCFGLLALLVVAIEKLRFGAKDE